MSERLSYSDEVLFRLWYRQQANEYNLNPDPDAPLQFYDYRRAWLAGAAPDKSGHWPSKFKKSGHPNLFVGRKDTRR
jgi:hypothetical protein